MYPSFDDSGRISFIYYFLYVHGIKIKCNTLASNAIAIKGWDWELKKQLSIFALELKKVKKIKIKIVKMFVSGEGWIA